MSFIKDYPCPICGANLYKVGFMDVLCDGYETTSHEFGKGYHKTYTDNQFYDQYIECNGCSNRLKIDPETFLKIVERTWDE